MAGTCECGNELSASIKRGVFLDWLRIGLLLKKEFASWSNEYYICHWLNLR